MEKGSEEKQEERDAYTKKKFFLLMLRIPDSGKLGIKGDVENPRIGETQHGV